MYKRSSLPRTVKVRQRYSRPSWRLPSRSTFFSPSGSNSVRRASSFSIIWGLPLESYITVPTGLLLELIVGRGYPLARLRTLPPRPPLGLTTTSCSQHHGH